MARNVIVKVKSTGVERVVTERSYRLATKHYQFIGYTSKEVAPEAPVTAVKKSESDPVAPKKRGPKPKIQENEGQGLL